jgi:diguanylate cyclase (GGDEF)-like protein/PAS domain S-box-containing protein
MSLTDFIRSNIETILENWEKFARDIPSGKRMDKLELRDHAIGILRTIADELELAATTNQKKIEVPAEEVLDTTEAMLHGIARIFQGFSVSDTLSEFRALRASVLQLWTKHNEKLLIDIQPTADEIMQFNSAIDQALTESVLQFSKEAERTTQMFDALYTSSPDLNYMFDLEGKLIFANRAFIDLVGQELDQIIGKNFINFNTSDSVEINQHLMESIDTKKITRGEMRWRDASNKETVYEYFFVPVLADEVEVKVITGTARDVTERKILEEKSHKRANYDSLTGLPNRDLFNDRLNLEIKRVERTGLPLALLFIDLDKFKETNDLFGHGVGDLLLAEVAQRINDCVRGTDTVARLGGDEFTVILTEVNRIPHVEVLAQEIVQSLAKPFHIKDEEIMISGSVGITLCPHDGEAASALLKNADQAMYVAKHSGGNHFSFFTPSMRNSLSASL